MHSRIRRPVRLRDGGYNASPALVSAEERQKVGCTPGSGPAPGLGQAAEPERNHRGQAEPDTEPDAEPDAYPGRNHTTSKQGTEPDTAAQAAEQGNTGRPADTSGNSSANGGPPRTDRRTGRAGGPG